MRGVLGEQYTDRISRIARKDNSLFLFKGVELIDRKSVRSVLPRQINLKAVMERQGTPRAEAQPACSVRERTNRFNGADWHPAMACHLGIDNTLMVDTVRMQVRRFSTEHRLQIFLSLLPFGFTPERAIKNVAIVIRCGCHVEGTLHASFDFEATHAEIGQLAHVLAERQVAHREGKTADIRTLNAIAFATRVCTPAPVSTPIIADSRHQAETAIAVAKRPVNKNLGVDAFRSDSSDFIERQFASQRHLRETPSRGDACAFEIMNCHLRAGVKIEGRGDGACEPGYPKILHNDGIRTRFGDRLNGFRHLGKIRLGHQRIERDVNLPRLFQMVRVVNNFAELIGREIHSLCPGREATESAVDGISAIEQCGIARFGSASG